MLSRLGGFTPNHPQRAGNQPISLSVYRATFSVALRDSGATETSISSGAVDQTAQLSGVIPDQESSSNESPAEHLYRETQTSGLVRLEERQPLSAMPSDREEMVAEGRTTINPPNDIVKQEKPSLRLPLRLAPRIDYPKTIDVELPNSFKNNHGNQTRKCHERKRRRLWRTEVVAPLPAGWNPNLLILRERAPLPSHTISIRFRKAPPSLIRLPTELRLHILRYLLKSPTVITNPRAGGHGGAQEKLTSTVHVHILRACRKLCYEGAPILYQENTFRFTEAAAWSAFRESQLSLKHDGIRHLELHTTVAERYCHRVFRVQGQQAVVQEIRTRGPAGWDWPFSSPWQLSKLHTLKLELKGVHLLPIRHPAPTTAHFNPDPRTIEGRNARLTQADIGTAIYRSCWQLRLRDITILGIPNLKLLLFLEVGILNYIYNDIGKYVQRNEDAVRYLSSRTGGWWETQSARSEAYWHLTNCRPIAELFRTGFGFARDGPSTGVGKWQLALLMFMRMRAATHEPIDSPARKSPSILWTW